MQESLLISSASKAICKAVRQPIHTEHAGRFAHDMHRYSGICHQTPHNDGAAWAGYFSWTLMPSASTVMSPIS